jgi:F-type H+-transporting ATPase subunit epsilon
MKLKILLPSQVFAVEDDILRLTAETSTGSWGFLPHRMDCVAALVPGILSVETRARGLAYIAIDLGVLVKTGMEIQVSVRRAAAGHDLASLRQIITSTYTVLSQTERDVRQVNTKLENGFLRRMMALHA